MKRLLFAAGLGVGIAMQACTGHNAAGVIPPAPGAPTTASAVAGLGIDSTRPAQIHGIAPAGFAYTATDRIALAKASDGGPVSRTLPMTVRVALQLRNVKELRLLIASHQVISRDAFVARFAPSPGDVQKVVSYLHEQGLSQITVEPNRVLISANGKAAQAESAFRTQIHSFVQRGKSVYANVTPAYVPKSLAGIVIAALGLTNVPAFQLNPYHFSPQNGPPAPRPAATTAPSPCTIYGLEILGFPTPLPEDPAVGCLRNYYPADFWRAYDVGNEPSAKKVNVAIMAEGSVTQSINDLRTNEKNDLLTQVPVVVKPVGISGTDTSGDDEWTLDMLASSGMAGAVKTIYLYDTTSLTDSDITLEYSHFVSDDLAPIGNSSFGGCEAFSYLDGSMLAMDELLNEGAAQGQTMFASTGDTGAYCPVGVGENGVPAGAPMVNYPASSPYTAAVGGTTLVTQSDGSYQGEATWYSSGGGISQFEYSPSWEASEQPIASEGESFRGVPDVMMDGDLQTGMNIYLSDVSGNWTIIGGTSLSSPLAAGVWARVIQAHGDQYAPPLYYSNFAAHPAGSAVTGPPPWQPDGAFHNILAGCDGLYCAGPGYSYAAGLGSFDVTQLIQQI
jgi:pseudomonalisin